MRQIMERREHGETYATIAGDFGVSPARVRQIWLRGLMLRRQRLNRNLRSIVYAMLVTERASE
jgi:DNA-directed RNA polymerase sigma subunit (sigma70/sigma32)